MTRANCLTSINNTKQAIATAINNKGGNVTSTTPFADYATAIDNLPSGGGSTDTHLEENRKVGKLRIVEYYKGIVSINASGDLQYGGDDYFTYSVILTQDASAVDMAMWQEISLDTIQSIVGDNAYNSRRNFIMAINSGSKTNAIVQNWLRAAGWKVIIFNG